MKHLLLGLIILTTLNANHQKIKLHLKWYPQFQFAGYFIAKELGYYDELGLDVEFLGPRPYEKVYQHVEKEEGVYAVASSEVVITHALGAKIVALYPLFQYSPSALIFAKDDAKDLDFKNSIVLLRKSELNAEVTSLIYSLGINRKNIKYIDKINVLDDFLNGKAQAIRGYVTNDSYILSHKYNKNVESISVNQDHISFYGDILYTSQKEVKNNPKRVDAFIKASLKGWKYAFEHVDEAINITQKYGSLKSKESLAYEALIMRSLTLVDIVNIGHTSTQKWDNIINHFKKMGLIDDNYNAKGFLYNKDKKYIDQNEKLKKLVLFVILGFFILIFLFTYVNNKLKKRIEDEIEQRLKNEKIMLHQSKLATLGEMISMIAHQWRQPLSAISSCGASLELEASLGTLDEKNVLENAQRIQNYTAHLSKTIDDFRYFFKPRELKSKTNLKSVVSQALDIIELTLTQNKINLILECEDDLDVDIYADNFVQVLVNLFKNAVDALVENKIENPEIIFRVKEEEKHVHIELEDNAGGVKAEDYDAIFEPYFSTKQKNGTGLGLYMSKIIVEKHLRGSLEVKNTKKGACFIIRLNK